MVLRMYTTTRRNNTAILLLLITLFLISPLTLGQVQGSQYFKGYLNQDAKEYEVLDFREADRYFVNLSFERVNDLTRKHFGSRLQGNAEYDISLMQRLLNERIVKSRPEDEAVLQAMGVVLGERLKQKHNLVWVRYLDKRGQSRALQIKRQDYFLFPVTMISRRVMAGIDVNILDIFKQQGEQISSKSDSIF